MSCDFLNATSLGLVKIADGSGKGSVGPNALLAYRDSHCPSCHYYDYDTQHNMHSGWRQHYHEVLSQKSLSSNECTLGDSLLCHDQCHDWVSLPWHPASRLSLFFESLSSSLIFLNHVGLEVAPKVHTKHRKDWLSTEEMNHHQLYLQVYMLSSGVYWVCLRSSLVLSVQIHRCQAPQSISARMSSKMQDSPK